MNLAQPRDAAGRFWMFIAWAAFCVVLVSCLSPVPAAYSAVIAYSDKTIHAGMYAVLLYAFAQAYRRHSLTLISVWLLCYGALIEALQHLLPFRTGSLADLLANAIGIALTLVFLKFRAPGHKTL